MNPETTRRTRLKRHPERGSFDASTIHAILDEGFVAHVGIATPEGPVVIPMVYARDGDTIYLHGSTKSRLLDHDGPMCVTVTLVDGLVLARSLFNHSMNYRSVVIYAKPVAVTDEAGKRRALDVITQHVVPGRIHDVRSPNEAELAATSVLALSLDEASAKIRAGPSGDDAQEVDAHAWKGVIPLRMVAGEPVPDPDNQAQPPPYVRDYRRP